MMRASTKGMAMASFRLLGLLCMALAGCDSAPPERVDFGAGVVASFVVKAEVKCAGAGEPSIAECAELPRSSGDARLAAMSAQDTYKIFQDACYPDLGMSKCEALVEQAYREAKSR
jgi:hypothetical protein